MNEEVTFEALDINPKYAPDASENVDKDTAQGLLEAIETGKIQWHEYAEKVRHAMFAVLPSQTREELAIVLAQDPNPIGPEVLVQAMWKFAEVEQHLSGEPLEWLVEPSGSLHDKLMFLAHFPTFTTTSEWEYGSSGDMGSPVMIQIEKKGFWRYNKMIADRYARRADVESRIDRTRKRVPMDKWSPELKGVHERFSDWLVTTSLAKVLVILGNAGKKSFLKASKVSADFQKFEFTVYGITLPFWLQYRSSQLLRVVLCAYHPEAILHGSEGGNEWASAALMDSQYNLAGVLLGMEVDLDYFRKEVTKHHGRRAMTSLGVLLAQVSFENSGVKAAWKDWTEVPDLVRTWLRKQDYDEALFTTYCAHPDFNGKSIAWIALHIMRKKSEATNSANVLGPAKNARLKEMAEAEKQNRPYKGEVIRARRLCERDPLFYERNVYRMTDSERGDPEDVLLECSSCSYVIYDACPTFMEESGAYIVRRHLCKREREDSGGGLGDGGRWVMWFYPVEKMPNGFVLWTRVQELRTGPELAVKKAPSKITFPAISADSRTSATLKSTERQPSTSLDSDSLSSTPAGESTSKRQNKLPVLYQKQVLGESSGNVVRKPPVSEDDEIPIGTGIIAFIKTGSPRSTPTATLPRKSIYLHPSRRPSKQVCQDP